MQMPQLPAKQGWDHPFVTIQTAVQNPQLETGDVIKVGQGIYKPGGKTLSVELKSGVSIQGGFAGYGATNPEERNPKVYVCIITGDIDGDDDPNDPFDPDLIDDNAYNVVLAPSDMQPPGDLFDILPEGASLDGFTITGGNNPSFAGAGITVNSGATPVIRDCVISQNRAGRGAGVATFSGSNPIFRNCTISGNMAVDETIGNGGGVNERTSN
jgi:hypothetical protein